MGSALNVRIRKVCAPRITVVHPSNYRPLALASLSAAPATVQVCSGAICFNSPLAHPLSAALHLQLSTGRVREVCEFGACAFDKECVDYMPIFVGIVVLFPR